MTQRPTLSSLAATPRRLPRWLLVTLVLFAVDLAVGLALMAYALMAGWL